MLVNNINILTRSNLLLFKNYFQYGIYSFSSINIIGRTKYDLSTIIKDLIELGYIEDYGSGVNELKEVIEYMKENPNQDKRFIIKLFKDGDLDSYNTYDYEINISSDSILFINAELFHEYNLINT